MDDTLYSAITDIKERLSAHTVLLAEIRKDNSEINETLKIQNGSIKAMKIDVVNNQNDIGNIERNCSRVQVEKKDSKSDIFKAIAIGLTLVGILFGTFKLLPNKVEKQIFFVKQVNDSLFTLSPALEMRSQTSFDIDTINKVFLDIRYTDSHKN